MAHGDNLLIVAEMQKRSQICGSDYCASQNVIEEEMMIESRRDFPSIFYYHFIIGSQVQPKDRAKTSFSSLFFVRTRIFEESLDLEPKEKKGAKIRGVR